MQDLLEPESAVPWVENAFEEGNRCTQAYEEMRQSYERLCGRLGSENEDPDLDCIVNRMEEIQKELCERMFFCGVRFAAMEDE